MNAIKSTAYRILVVDDTKTDRDLFKYILTQAGFTVDVVADGVQALSTIAAQDYNVVLCDYLMPNMDGYQFLLKLRENPKYSHIIVIIITSDENEDTKVKLLKGGANDFVHKGVSNNEIVARIRVHLDAQGAQANRKVLELAGEIADGLNQPLSVLVAAVDVLKEKISELPAGQKAEFLEGIKTINKQADSMIVLAERLKKLWLDTKKSYKIDKK